MLARPPFPEVIDNTMMNNFRSCPRYCLYENILHFKPGERSVHLLAGGAYASGLEATRRAFYQDGLPQEEAILKGIDALFKHYGDYDCPPESPKSAIRLAQALDYYFEIWPLATDTAKPKIMPSGLPAIEFSFAEPMEVLHPETGQPLIYAGRSDMIATMEQGSFIEDDKTATQLGARWYNQWEMRAQFSGYAWAARKADLHIDGILVRGIAILKSTFNHAQALTYRAGWEIDRWEEQTTHDIKRMVQCWESGYWDIDMGEACAAYGGCNFLQVCKSREPEIWLDSYFTRREWNPITRIETTLPPLERRETPRD